MIDSFKINAEVQGNKLLIQLRGYFMKSELELAFYLAQKESEKLTDGYDVILDLDGMHTHKNIYSTIQSRVRKLFLSNGAKNVKLIGAVPQMQLSRALDLEYFAFDGVGFYPN